MKRLLLLVSMLTLSGLPVSAVNWVDVEKVEHRIEQLGARVYWMRLNKDICATRGLLGVYRVQQRTVFMCQQRIRGVSNTELLATLKHEGWHAVQQICNRGRAVLTDNKIRALLSELDKQTLRASYHPGQHRLEAEARAIEQIPTYAYLNGVNHYCS